MRDSNPTRRDVLRLLAVSGVGSLAGCPGSPSDDTAVTPARVPTETAPARTPAGTPDSRAPGSTLRANDGDSSDEFGEAIAVSGDGTIAVVGAPADEDPHGELAGSAYVFEGTDGEWTQQAKLVPDSGDTFDGFGGAVSLSRAGTTALVGAPGDLNPNGNRAGAAYVFTGQRGAWTQRAGLRPTDGDSGDAFGRSVALSRAGTTAVVGAPADEDPNGSLAGSAYVFEATGGSWRQGAKLVADDGDSFDSFGRSVAVSAATDTALVGAPADEDPNGRLGGSAYLFGRRGGTWAQQGKLTPDDGSRLDRFGWTTGLSGDGSTAVVGRYSDTASSATVFELTDGDWSRETALTPEGGPGSEFFAFAVTVAGDGALALVGAPGDPDGAQAGSAYLFDRTEGAWTQRARLTPDDGDSSDLFGRGVGLSGDGTTAVVGAPFDSTPDGEFAGSASVFTASRTS